MKLELRLKWRCEGSSPATSPSTTAELQCQEITCPAPLLLLSHLEQADTTTQRTSQRESEKKARENLKSLISFLSTLVEN